MMKNLILTCMLAVMVLGCKSKSATATKLDRDSQVMMKGNWTLDKVTTPVSNLVKVTSLQLADSECFEGSSWKFISNNNKGEMALNGGSNCPSFSSPITWFINREGQFVLKVLNAGEKAKKVRDGYILGVQNQSENEFELFENIDVAGKPSKIVYHFRRN